jgi:hypothetical protein
MTPGTSSLDNETGGYRKTNNILLVQKNPPDYKMVLGRMGQTSEAKHSAY